MKKNTATKAAFILNYPKLSAEEVIEKGKAAKMKFSKAYVYSVRTAANKKANEARATKREETKAIERTAPVAAPVPAMKPGIAKARPVDALRAAAAELGIEGAIATLNADRDLLRAYGGGK